MEFLLSEPSKFSLSRCCKLLGINRSGVYYQAKPDSEAEVAIRGKIYTFWDSHNNKGSRTITADLREYENLTINRKKVQRVMRELDIKGILPKSNLSKIGDLQYKFPYYLAGMNIYAANMVWETDITYCILPTGKMYVISLLDVFSRFVVGAVVTNSLDTSGCIECLNQALSRYGTPYIINSDQGSQYTSYEWTNKLKSHNIIISMDAKGRWSDNVYIERFWRTLKYECIYLLGIERAQELHIETTTYITYYNTRRLHSALGYKTPEFTYLSSIAKNETFIAYCDWPECTTRDTKVKKRVLPTVRNSRANEYCMELVKENIN